MLFDVRKQCVVARATQRADECSAGTKAQDLQQVGLLVRIHMPVNFGHFALNRKRLRSIDIFATHTQHAVFK